MGAVGFGRVLNLRVPETFELHGPYCSVRLSWPFSDNLLTAAPHSKRLMPGQFISGNQIQES